MSLRKRGGVSTYASAELEFGIVGGSSRVFPDVSQDYLRQRVEESTQMLQQRHAANVDFQRLYETLVEDFLKNNYDKEPVASTSAASGSRSHSRTLTRPLVSSSSMLGASVAWCSVTERAMRSAPAMASHSESQKASRLELVACGCLTRR